MESPREREVLRLLEPFRRSRRAPQVFRSVDLDSATASHVKVGSDDTALAAFAQLGTLRLKAERGMIILFGREHEHLLAESTQTLSLQTDSTHAVKDGLWIGTASFSRAQGISNTVQETWAQSGKPRSRTEGADYYHTHGLSPHSFIINDVQQNESYKHLFGQFNDQTRFIAAVPLLSRRHNIIGTYLIADRLPRYGISETELIFMEDMAQTVFNHLESKRVAMQKAKAERLIKGLAIFSAGGQSLREWWRDVNDAEQDRGRRQVKETERVNAEEAEDAADAEFGTATKDTDTLREKVAQQMEATKRSATTAEDLREAHSSPHDFGYTAERSKSKSRVTEDTVPQHSKFDLAKATREVLSRASNIIREAMNMDGVVFLDTGFADSLDTRRRAMSHTRSDTTQSGTSSEDFVSSSDSSGSSQQRKRHRRQARTVCSPLAWSTRTISSLKTGFEPPQFRAIPHTRMERLLRKYPRGKILNFSEDGSLDTSSESEVAENAVAMAILDGKLSARRKGDTVSPIDAVIIQSVCAQARSVAFIPVWDAHRERWRAGALVWSAHADRCIMSGEDLSYLWSFVNTMTAELTRLDTISSDEAKSTFISCISHELRSPLHGVLAGSEMLLGSPLTQFQHEMASTIKLAGSTLLETINTILDFTKVNSGKTGTQPNPTLDRFESDASDGVTGTGVDLAALTEGAVDTIVAAQRYQENAKSGWTGLKNADVRQSHSDAADSNVQVIVTISHRPSWFTDISSGSWSRIVVNLVGNAMKYTDSGYVHIRLHSVDDRIILSIQDTGIGISDDFQKHHLYTPFRQEDPLKNGTGLGLYIVKQLVQQIGGHMVIESNSTALSGTKIQIEFPGTFIPPPNTTSEASNLDIAPLPRRRDQAPRISFVANPSARTDQPLPEGAHYDRGVRDDMIKSSIVDTCSHWLQAPIRVVDRIPPRSETDICILTESSLESLRHSDPPNDSSPWPRLLVLSGMFGASQARTRSEQAQDLETFVDPPFGPRRMYRALMAALQPETPMMLQSTNWTDGLRIPSRRESSATRSAAPTPPETNRARIRSSLGSNSKPKHLLLVEDNEINMKLLVVWCKQLNCIATPAVNGLEAVKVYTSNPSAFDLILMDISMPVMDGLTATREIRKLEVSRQLTRCKVVALTAAAGDDTQAHAKAVGVDVFLIKPASLKQIKELVDTV